MKIVPESKNVIRSLTLKETVDHLQAIYGDTIGSDFDNLCVQKYEIIFEYGEPKSVDVIYNKLKVTHNKDVIAYWPIQLHKEELGILAAKKLIEGLK